MLFKGIIEMSTGRIRRAVKKYYATFEKEYLLRVMHSNFNRNNTRFNHIIKVEYQRISNIYRMIYNRFEHSADYRNIDGLVFEEVKFRFKRRQVMK